MAPVNFYALLGVSWSASAEEIRAAYERLARMWHPDKAAWDKEEEEARARFKQIQDAYKVLSDPKMRSMYDAVLRNDPISFNDECMYDDDDLGLMLDMRYKGEDKERAGNSGGIYILKRREETVLDVPLILMKPGIWKKKSSSSSSSSPAVAGASGGSQAGRKSSSSSSSSPAVGGASGGGSQAGRRGGTSWYSHQCRMMADLRRYSRDLED